VPAFIGFRTVVGKSYSSNQVHCNGHQVVHTSAWIVAKNSPTSKPQTVGKLLHNFRYWLILRGKISIVCLLLLLIKYS